jgi:hypothetical protein
MKITLLSRAGLFLFGLFLCAGFIARAELPFQPLYDAPANAQEELQLNSIFSQARAASADVTGADAGFQRRQIAIELNNELEGFVSSHTNSAWTPGVRLWLARQAQLRSAYSLAMDHYGEVWIAARGVANPAARQMAGEAMGGLGMSLASAGLLSELDAWSKRRCNWERIPSAPSGRVHWNCGLGRESTQPKPTSAGCFAWINWDN